MNVCVYTLYVQLCVYVLIVIPGGIVHICNGLKVKDGWAGRTADVFAQVRRAMVVNLSKLPVTAFNDLINEVKTWAERETGETCSQMLILLQEALATARKKEREEKRQVKAQETAARQAAKEEATAKKRAKREADQRAKDEKAAAAAQRQAAADAAASGRLRSRAFLPK